MRDGGQRAHQSIHRPATAVSIGLLLVVGLAACSSTPATLDGAKLEANISNDLKSADLTATTTACPHDRRPQDGDQFSCTVSIEGGGTLVYTVTQTSDSGTYRYALAPGQVIDGDQAGAAVAADIAATGPALADAKVTCPKTVVAPGGTATFECAVSAGGAAAKVRVTAAPDHPLAWVFVAG